MKALPKLSITARRLNSVLELWDPNASNQYRALQEELEQELDFYQALCSFNSSLWHGRMILFSIQTPLPRLTQKTEISVYLTVFKEGYTTQQVSEVSQAKSEQSRAGQFQ